MESNKPRLFAVPLTEAELDLVRQCLDDRITRMDREKQQVKHVWDKFFNPQEVNQ